MDASILTGLMSLVYICFCFIYILAIAASVLFFVLWVWMLIDLIQRKDNEFGSNSTGDTRIIWLLLLLFTGFIGAIAYYFIIYKKYPRN